MADEIELKFLVEDTDVVSKIETYLKAENLSYTHNQKTLINSYFDTPDMAFRKLDFGLRTRTYKTATETSSEQTIKTSGQVVGGLHKRPEYNVNINSNQPELSLFPDDIWPSHTNPNHLQETLICLFSVYLCDLCLFQSISVNCVH